MIFAIDLLRPLQLTFYKFSQWHTSQEGLICRYVGGISLALKDPSRKDLFIWEPDG